MRVKTYGLTITYKNGTKREVRNLSLIATKRYIDWFVEQPDVAYIDWFVEPPDVALMSTWF